MGSIAQAGGHNSIENFARSWQRAVAFHEITPSRGSYQYAEEDSDLFSRRISEDALRPPTARSLLRQQLEDGINVPEVAAEDDDLDRSLPRKVSSTDSIPRRPGRGTNDIFVHAPHLASSYSSNFSGTYGSLADRVNEASRVHAARLYEEQQATGTQEPDKETEPLLIRAVEQDDGKIIVQVVGQSTIYQTILNSINVLIGVGLLSLPLALRYSGWVIGVLFLTFSYLSTGYTASLLGKCLTKHPGLITFVDLAYVAFGPRARVLVGIMFNLELVAACVALFVLFADSLHILLEDLGLLEFKIICGLIMIPLSFVPFRFLGYTSLLGIICCMLSKYFDLLARSVLTSRSRCACRCKWAVKAALTGIVDRTCGNVSLPQQLDDSSTELWSTHVPVGRPQRVSIYHARHAASREVSTESLRHFQLHGMRALIL